MKLTMLRENTLAEMKVDNEGEKTSDGQQIQNCLAGRKYGEDVGYIKTPALCTEPILIRSHDIGSVQRHRWF